MTDIDKQIAQEAFFLKYKYMSIEEFEALMKAAHTSVIGKITGNVNWNQNRIFKLIKLIEEEYDSVYALTEKSSMTEMEALTAAYLTSESKILDQKFNPKLIDEVYNFDNDLVQGYTFGQLFKASSDQAKARARKILAKNLLEGNNPKQFSNELYHSGVTLTKKQLLTSVRTYSKHLREKVKNETESIVEGTLGWTSLSTLDSRTTAICVSLDKEFYDIREYKNRQGIPDKPPRHFNCRSILVRTTEETMSYTRAAKGDKGGEQVDTRTTFNSFLQRNPNTARQLLGKKKYDLYKSGRYNIKDFISDDGQWFNLQELNAIL